MLRNVLEQLADGKSAHALARQIALCSCIVQTSQHQRVLQEHLLNPGDLFRPLKADEVSFYSTLMDGVGIVGKIRLNPLCLPTSFLYLANKDKNAFPLLLPVLYFPLLRP